MYKKVTRRPSSYVYTQHAMTINLFERLTRYIHLIGKCKTHKSFLIDFRTNGSHFVGWCISIFWLEMITFVELRQLLPLLCCPPYILMDFPKSYPLNYLFSNVFLPYPDLSSSFPCTNMVHSSWRHFMPMAHLSVENHTYPKNWTCV